MLPDHVARPQPDRRCRRGPPAASTSPRRVRLVTRDFFFDSTGQLTYASHHRFLNNPGASTAPPAPGRRSARGAGHLPAGHRRPPPHARLHLVRRKPHMQKICAATFARRPASSVHQESRAPRRPKWQQSVDRVLDETRHFVNDGIEAARSSWPPARRPSSRTTALFNKYPARLTITKIAPDLRRLTHKHYSLSIEGTRCWRRASEAAGKESDQRARCPRPSRRCSRYGAPIRVKWRRRRAQQEGLDQPVHGDPDNRSQEVTEVSSSGGGRRRPRVCDPEQRSGILSYDEPVAGKDGPTLPAKVSGWGSDKAWWTWACSSSRCHRRPQHNVMSLSRAVRGARRRASTRTGDVEVDGRASTRRPSRRRCSRRAEAASTLPPWTRPPGTVDEARSAASSSATVSTRAASSTPSATCSVSTCARRRSPPAETSGSWHGGACNAKTSPGEVAPPGGEGYVNADRRNTATGPPSMSRSRGASTPVERKFPELL